LKQKLIKDRRKRSRISRSGRRKIDSYIREVELAGRRKWRNSITWKGGF